VTQASSVLGDDELLAQTRSGTVSYDLSDGQNNVRLLTDANGAITDQYRYDAYGNLLSSQGTTVNPYRYTGQQLDSLTGLYDLRARYYDPTSGRFLSRDTAGIDVSNPVEVNRYSYAQDDPINLIDPSGHGEEEEEGGLYAIILGAVRTVGAGVGRLIPRLTEEEIAILLAGLGALGLWFLLHLLATQTLPLPRAATQAATATPGPKPPIVLDTNAIRSYVSGPMARLYLKQAPPPVIGGPLFEEPVYTQTILNELGGAIPYPQSIEIRREVPEIEDLDLESRIIKLEQHYTEERGDVFNPISALGDAMIGSTIIHTSPRLGLITFDVAFKEALRDIAVQDHLGLDIRP
jgi:RHS repeat-associated protein